MRVGVFAGCAGIAFAIALTAVPARADGQLECRYRIARVHEKLDRVVAKYGADSAHALKVQRRLEEERDWCWRRYQGWWDEHENRWRTDHW